MPRPPADPPRKPRPPLPRDIATRAEMGELSPLAYMLMVMRNPKVSQRRRDRMAVVAARYLHRRPADSVGKKEQLLAAARQAGGAAWADDLDGDWQQ